MANSMPMMNGDSTNSVSPMATPPPKYDEKKLAQWVSERYRDMKSARTRQNMVWYVNMAMYRGNQYVELLPRLSKLSVPKAPPYRVRHVTNRIKPIIRTELSRLTSQKPSASVVPASSDDEDMFAAYAAEQVWETISGRSQLVMEFQEVCWWMLICGNAFMKTWWDPNKVDYENSPDPNGVQGDICLGHVTPFHLFVPDFREVNIQNQPYVLNAYTKPLEWVKRFYGPLLDGKNILPDTVAANEILEDAYLNVETNVDKQPDSVLCQEMWIKSGGIDENLLPAGDYVIHVIGDNVINVGKMYRHGRYPFTHFRHIPSGSFYGTSVIEDLVPLQREYNRTRSQIIEAKNRMAKPQLIYQQGSIDPTKITNEPGLAIPYKYGMEPPQPLPLSPLPTYVLQELDRTVQDMEDISGQHEVSRGGVPPGVTAATAISYLQEKDDSLLSHTYLNVEKGMEEIAKQSLSLVQEFWDTPRLIKATGESGMFDALMLKSSDLKNNTDIRMEGGSSLPTSKAAKQALIMDMMKMGFIDPNKGLQILEIGGVQRLYENLKRDESHAQRENIRMKGLNEQQIQEARIQWETTQQQEMMQISQIMEMGQQPDPTQPFQTISAGVNGQPPEPLQMMPVIQVNTWDNHEVHIQVHNDYRKSQQFELLSDAVKAQYELHVQGHLAAVSQAMMEAQQFAGGMGEPMPGEEMPPPGEEMPPEESNGPPPQPGGM
jgi:hypothetical protein